jgi:hypothetical protein
MPLQSNFFKGNAKLEACSRYDQSHVAPGAVGEHVGLIQKALSIIDGLVIHPGEVSRQTYGTSTSAAVLLVKKKRHIINYSYQTREDNIVGKMTIAALDAEMAARERPPIGLKEAICLLPNRYWFGPSSKTEWLVAGPPVAPPTPKDIAIGDVHEVRQWILAARDWIWDARMWVFDPSLESKDPRFAVRVAGTDTHFHFRKKPAQDQAAFLKELKLKYDKMLELTADPDRYFGNDEKIYPPENSLSRAWAHAPIGGFKNGNDEPKVWFRSIFANVKGKKCRCAMIIHECAHSCCDALHYANDWPLPNGAADRPDGKTTHPRDYANLTPDEAAANAYTYASFAANARFNADIRPGAHDLDT